MLVRIATFNIRSIFDRWPERRPLLVEAFRQIAPHVAGLQEVDFEDEKQDALLADAVPDRRYQSFAGETRPGFGNAILVGDGTATAHETRGLELWRVAHRVRIELPGGRALWFANTHLHHVADDVHVRVEQAKVLCDFMAVARPDDTAVVVGDFNALPDEASCAVMREAGFRSAHHTVHGHEPPITWPSGIQAETMDLEGDRGCLDYIWVRGPARIVEAHVAANEPPAHDPTIYPSDHFAVVADLEL
ncbi:MAG TPA: endonuclease/exonuclease/phosphatase family protein [Candidatus Binatia bacterium]|jgi:endonuclease/exonuclease/phosphatase family metal-dependent hydrolase|nr:endonuclease/exonuclease/phosphatase family protein [Candidatus Binatia bacterium]